MPRGLVPRVRRGKPAAGVACRAPVTSACSLCVGEGKHPPLDACRNIRRVVGVVHQPQQQQGFRVKLVALHCVLVLSHATACSSVSSSETEEAGGYLSSCLGVEGGSSSRRCLPKKKHRASIRCGRRARNRLQRQRGGRLLVVVLSPAQLPVGYTARPCATALLRYCITALLRYFATALLTSLWSLHCLLRNYSVCRLSLHCLLRNYSV